MSQTETNYPRVEVTVPIQREGGLKYLLHRAAIGHPLTSTRVHLVVTHGYGRANR